MRDGYSAVLELTESQMRMGMVFGAIVLGVKVESNGESYNLIGKNIAVQFVVAIQFWSLLHGRKRRGRKEPQTVLPQNSCGIKRILKDQEASVR